MCFVLYVGTSEPIPGREWNDQAPDLTVTTLSEREAPVARHFSKPSVQNIGSTSLCGCDFPSVMQQNGGWPWYEALDLDEAEQERVATEQDNRERLVALLRQISEASVELYGVWDGNADFAAPPANREEITLHDILRRDFRFKEQGFYVVRLPQE